MIMPPLPREQPQPTDDELIEALRAGSQAVAHLLDRYHDYLLKIANEEIDPKLRGRTNPSDVVQKAHLAVVERLEQGILVVRDRKSLKAWLRMVIKNALHKERRDQCRDVRDVRKEQQAPEGHDPAAAGPTPSSLYRRAEREDALRLAINTLPEADRLLYRLKYVHGWRDLQLAGLLEGEETDAGRMRIQRRLAKIRHHLAEKKELEPFKV